MVSEYVKEEIEGYRKKCLLFKLLRAGVLGMGCGIAVFLLDKTLRIITSGKDMIIMFPFIMIAMLVICVPFVLVEKQYIQHGRDFNALYKKHVVMDVLYTQLDDVDCFGNTGFSERQIKDFQLARLANHMRTGGYLKAVYNDIVFEQADVSITYRRHKRRDITYFQGRMLKMYYSPKQVEDVRIFTKSFKYREDSKAYLFEDFFGTIHVVGADTTGQTGTTDVEFSKQFDIFSANEQDVQELLTPEFRETLKRLASGYDSMAFHFKENAVYVAIASQKNTFECSVDKPLQYEVEEQNIIADVNEIKKFIDALNGGY